MSVSLLLLVTAGILVACGVYLVMDRTLTRILIGLALASNGVNILMVALSGPAGAPALLERYVPDELTDALPQAMALTAIVITLGTTAFGLALAYRSWHLVGHDEVADDVEDRRLATRARLHRVDGRIADPGSDREAQRALDDLIEDEEGAS